MPATANQKKRDAEATKLRILEAALVQFGQFGFQGASLRQIVAAAGANVAAANYYFGSKEGLLVATIDHFIVSTQEYRFQLLEDCTDISPDTQRVRALISAYLRPHFEITLGQRNEAYARLLSQVLTEAHPTLQKEIDRALLPVRQRLAEYLCACYPEASRELVARVIGLVLGVLMQGPFSVDQKSLAFHGLRKDTFEDALAEATEFAFGGVCQLLGVPK